MTLKIHTYGDPILRLKAQEVDVFDQALKKLVAGMFETMAKADGVGLAAPQVGVSKRLFVIDLRQGPTTRLVVINPVLQLSGDLVKGAEGCLSVPGIHGDISRPSHVVLKAQNEKGEPFQLEADGLMARALQHETDHLDGKFFVDRMSGVRRSLISGKLKRLEKNYAEGRVVDEPHESTDESIL